MIYLSEHQTIASQFPMPKATFIDSAIYTRSDLGVKSSMTGSLSRTIQQY